MADEILNLHPDPLSLRELRNNNNDNVTKTNNNFTAADNKANAIQAQVNTLVINGDSSPAAAQAAVDANGIDKVNLKVRLDDDYNEVKLELAENETKVKSIISLDTYDHLVVNGDWSDALQALSDDVLASLIDTTIKVTGTKKITKTVTLDVSYASYDFTDSYIDATTITTGNCFVFKGGSRTFINLSYQNMRSVKNLFMRGGGSTSTSKALVFNSPTGTIQGVSFHSCDIQEFGVGMSFEQNAYLLSFFNTSVGRCGVALDMPSGFTNYGENIAFYGGVVSNNTLCIRNNNANGNFHMNGTSIDYSKKIVEIANGGVFFTNTHVEHNNDNSVIIATPFTLGTGESCKLVWFGGILMFKNALAIDYVFETANTSQSGGIVLNSVAFINVKTNSGILCGGTGLLAIENPNILAASGNMSVSPITSYYRNKLIDGKFEEASILDAYLTNDTAAITSRTDGTNIDLTLDAVVFYEGAKSLKVTKVNTSSLGRFGFLVPVDVNKHHSYRFRLRKENGKTGIIYVNERYTNLRNVDSNGIPTHSKLGTVKTRNVDLGTIADSTWVQYGSSLVLSKAPSWATHYLVEFNMDSVNGYINVDDFIITSL